MPVNMAYLQVQRPRVLESYASARVFRASSATSVQASAVLMPDICRHAVACLMHVQGDNLDLPNIGLQQRCALLTNLHAANMNMVTGNCSLKSCQFLQGSMVLAYDDQRNILTLLFGLDASL